MENDRPLDAQPPAKPRKKLRFNDPSSFAAGIPGVTESLRHMAKYMQPGEALTASLKLNQKGGYDCPGCAWPDPDGDRSSIAEYCENGIKAIAEEAQRTTIGADFFARHSVEELSSWPDYELGKAGRLAEPMVLRPGEQHYTPISWDDAFQLMANELNGLAEPDEAVFYTSGRASNEAAFLFQLFARQFGTNNLPDCSNMCHESTSVGLARTIGIGKGTVTLGDIHDAELIVIIGQNPGTNHPRMLTALEKCKENGGRIIAINPLPEVGLMQFVNPQRPGKILGRGTQLADLHLPVRVNGDIALLKAIMQLLWHEERNRPGAAFDWDFITAKTEGYEAFINALRTYDFNDLARAGGVSRDKIKRAAEMIRRAEKFIVCWAMGVTQHENGVANVQEIVNLLLLRGAFGKPGAGACPVRGHSNVQGDRTVGVWDKLKPELRDRLREVFQFEPPANDGYSSVDAVRAMHDGRVKFFFGLGGNFLRAVPDTAYAETAMRNCRMTVQVSTKLNRSHLVTGRTALILPCLGRTNIDLQAEGEQFVSTENSTGVVQMSKGVLPPSSDQQRSEPAIIAGLARATLGARTTVDWEAMTANYDNIRYAIEQTIDGFTDYNARVREPGGFYLPNGPRDGLFTTPNGKAQFTVNPLPDNSTRPGEFLLTSIRSHDQFNTTIYGLHDRYRGVHNGRRVIFMHPDDIRAAGLSKMSAVDVINRDGGVERRAENFLVAPYDIPKGCIAAYYPEMNVLVPLDKHDPESKCPSSKMVRVSIEPRVTDR